MTLLGNGDLSLFRPQIVICIVNRGMYRASSTIAPTWKNELYILLAALNIQFVLGQKYLNRWVRSGKHYEPLIGF